MGENNRRMRKNEEMFLSCPPEVESLATHLFTLLVGELVENYCGKTGGVLVN